MSVVRLQHIGIAVKDFRRSWNRFDRVLGMRPRDFRHDQANGMQHDARVPLGNRCWVHVVYNWNPESRVYQFLRRHGEGLEHIALETDDIGEEVKRLRRRNVPIFKDTIFDAHDGYEAFVYPDDAIGFTVELIQPHPTSWSYPEPTPGIGLSTKLGVIGASHLTAVVRDVEEASRCFRDIFGLRADHHRIRLGNNCGLELVADPSGEPRNRGLERLVLETKTLEADRIHLRRAQVPVIGGNILDAERGVGFTVELQS